MVCRGSEAAALLFPSARTPPKGDAGGSRLFDMSALGMQAFTPRGFKENQVLLRTLAVGGQSCSCFRQQHQ